MRKIRVIIIIVLLLIMGVILSVNYTINFKREEKLQGEFIAGASVSSLMMEKGFHSYYFYVSYNQNMYKNSNVVTKSDLIINLKNSEYFPILSFLNDEVNGENLYYAYESIGAFISSYNFTYSENAFSIFTVGMDDFYMYSTPQDESLSFEVTKRMITKDFMNNTYNSYLEDYGYSETYFYEHILKNDFDTLLLVQYQLSIDSKEYDDMTQQEVSDCIDYLSENYEDLYNNSYEEYIAYYLNEFGVYLQGIDTNTIEFEIITISIVADPVKERNFKYENIDRYYWAVNIDDLYEDLDELNLPYLLY